MNFKFIKNVFAVMVSNLFVLLSGVAVGILLPVIMNVSEYGYYKIFTLYLTYAGLTHLGFVNGIYLDYSGANYCELKKEKFTAYFRYFIIEQITASVALAGILILLNRLSTKNIIADRMMLFIVLESFLMNIINYFQLISQSVQKFKQLSVINTLKSILFLLLIIMLFFLVKYGIIEKVAAYDYIYLYLAISALIAASYLWLYKELCFGKGCSIVSCADEIVLYHKNGINLLTAGIVSTLIFTLDRQFVSVLFDVKTYGIYSFAYSILSICTTMVGSIAIVFYPALKTMNKDEMMGNYAKNIAYLSLALSFALVLYYPLKSFLVWFLPDYASSVEIFRMIFPGLCVSSTISVVLANYYKALEEMRAYSGICIFILVLSAICNIAAYGLFKTPLAISAASVLTVILWYMLADGYLHKRYGLNGKTGLVINIAALAAFYISAYMENSYGMFIYIAVLAAVTFMYRKFRGN